MKTLERQLLEYGAFHEREQGTLSLNDAATTTRTAFVVDQTVNRRPWRVVAAAAAVVLILIGGVGLLMRVGTDSETPPAQEQIEPDQSPESPRLTDDIPPELESGTLPTPAGDARWVRLTGDGSTVPSGDAVSWPNGFAIFSSRPTRLWVSPDGVGWQIQPIPVSDDAQGVTLTLVDGEYWLMSSNPNQVWRSTDGVTWDEYDSSELRPPVPVGLFGNLGGFMGYEPPVTGNGLTLSYARYAATFPFQEYVSQLIDGFNVFAEPGCGSLRKLAPGVFKVAGNGTEPCLIQAVELRFEETGSGLRVLDNATGAILGEVLGADLSHIERVAGDGYIERRILILGDSEITQVEPPWASSSGIKLFGTDEWVYAYVEDWSDGEQHVTVWRTDDGRSWTDLGAPSFLQNAPVAGWVQFWPLESSLAVTILNYADDGSFSNVGWESSDGITWEPAPMGRPDETNIVRLKSGWFANGGSREGLPDGKEWWAYIDETWVSLADLGMEQALGCVEATGIGNTTFFNGGACNNRQSAARDFWVFSTEPSD